jgi:hypothetical protein
VDRLLRRRCQMNRRRRKFEAAKLQRKPGNALRTTRSTDKEFALQTNTRSASLALCEPRLQSGSC